MANNDPLSLLRTYYVQKREILQQNGMICFGEYCWPKNVKTNYLIYSSSRDGPNKSYYTLECLLYFLNNIQLQHPTYVKQAAALNIPVVQRPDRKDLLAYLQGEITTSTSIDKSAPIELPKSVAQLRKESAAAAAAAGPSPAGTAIGGGHHGAAIGSSAADRDDGDGGGGGGGPTPSKLARLDEMEKVRKQFAARLDGPKMKKTSVELDAAVASAAGAGGTTSGQTDAGGVASLRDALSNDQIAALKAKRLAKKRSTIIDNIDGDSELDGVQGLGLPPTGHSVLLEYDSNFTKEIQNKERTWRNRANILQSSGKNFQQTVFPLLQTIKAREEGGGGARKPGIGLPGIRTSSILPPSILPSNLPTSVVPGGPGAGIVGPGGIPGVVNGPATPGAPQQYNRYDQERFTKNDAPSGFRIDTTSSYHGLTLQSVTAGAPPNKGPLTGSAVQNGSNGTSGPGAVPGTHHAHHPLHVSKPTKRVSRTPIIIIPATNTSLITMYNARAILQDLKYIDSKSCDQRRDNEVLIQRRKADNSTVPYRIVDNPLKLAADDWNRVVAVFVQGPAWQFKGWPWDGNPVEIFARIKAFHLKFDEMKLDNNVSKWSVEIIELSRSKRHLDRANLLKFWSLLDQHIMKYKHNVVRF